MLFTRTTGLGNFSHYHLYSFSVYLLICLFSVAVEGSTGDEPLLVSQKGITCPDRPEKQLGIMKYIQLKVKTENLKENQTVVSSKFTVLSIYFIMKQTRLRD